MNPPSAPCILALKFFQEEPDKKCARRTFAPRQNTSFGIIRQCLTKDARQGRCASRNDIKEISEMLEK